MTTEIKPDWQPNPWKGKRVLQLGCGRRPMEGAVNHDRGRWGDWIDADWDLERMPWPVLLMGTEFNVGAENPRESRGGWLIEVPPSDEEIRAGGSMRYTGPLCDVIVAIDLIEHIEDALGFVNECHALLAPGGLLVMRGGAHDNPASYIDPSHKHWFREESFNFFDRRNNLGDWYGRHYVDSLCRPLTEWHVIKIERVNPDPRWPDTPDLQWTMVKL